MNIIGGNGHVEDVFLIEHAICGLFDCHVRVPVTRKSIIIGYHSVSKHIMA